VIADVDARGVVVAVGQSFGNCPQYIQPRDLVPVAARAAPAERFGGLDRAAAQAIASADVCFVASGARTDEPTGGVDVSHRGGPRGFIRVDGDVLTIPDYRGNRYFNTLGNLVSHPRAALVFPDFTTGDLLHVQGTTEIQWDGPEVRAVPGAERLWRVRVERGWRRRGALALHSLATGDAGAR
jgi:predicted pyridoxine 5'-phosphate oxidase superfamily flavin-nucleotide-binding protein